MVSLMFYGGVGEIGGNKILLEDSGTRIFLDFGMSFRQNGLYFSEFLAPRKCNGLGDFFVTGLLPDIPGVYREDYLCHMGRGKEDRGVDAVLISHAHMDHIAYVHHMRRDIELVMSEGTYAIMRTLQDTKTGGFNDMLEMAPTFKIRPSKRGSGYTKITKRDEEYVYSRPVRLVKSGVKFKLDNMEIVPYEVDHSLPGATSYLIHTSEGSILYTGDLRFHGYLGDKTRLMIEEVSGEEVSTVITEGTRIEESTSTSETEVYKHARKLVGDTKGLAVATFPARDFTRLSTFHRIAQETGRKLVVGFSQAYQLEQFSKYTDRYPSVDDPNICLYAERKTWGLTGRDNIPSNIEGVCYPENIYKMDYSSWEREMLCRDNTVDHIDLQDQSEYILYCSYFQLNELIDIKPVEGRYIRSITEPFSDEMRLDADRVKNWLDLLNLELYGMNKEDKLHASGHANGVEISDMLEKINPIMIIPIHTEKPEYLKERFSGVKLPEENIKIVLE